MDRYNMSALSAHPFGHRSSVVVGMNPNNTNNTTNTNNTNTTNITNANTTTTTNTNT